MVGHRRYSYHRPLRTTLWRPRVWAPSRIGVRSLCGPWASTPAQSGLHDAADHGSIGEYVVVVGALVAGRMNVLTGSPPVRIREGFISTALSSGASLSVL